MIITTIIIIIIMIIIIVVIIKIPIMIIGAGKVDHEREF